LLVHCIDSFLSPFNTPSEIGEKRALYFDADATEVWIYDLDRSITFFVRPDRQLPGSILCPVFPSRIP
jgi:Uma2 family endonuclease